MAEQFIWNELRDDGVTVFVTSGCLNSHYALMLLKRYNFQPGRLRVIDITERRDVWLCLQQMTGQMNTPYVFFGKSSIGGFSDLQRLDKDLPMILQRIGALR